MRNKYVVLFLLILGCKDPTPPAHGALPKIVPICGTKRWPVKTGVDQYTLRGGKFPVAQTTIEWLVSQPHQKGDDQRSSPVETSQYLVKNTHLIFTKKEADKDYHLVITDGTRTMVIEAVNPDCAVGSPFLPQMKQVYETLTRTRIGKAKVVDQEVTVQGLGFMDFVHGQHGVAPNGIEIHPILAFCFGHDCTF